MFYLMKFSEVTFLTLIKLDQKIKISDFNII